MRKSAAILISAGLLVFAASVPARTEPSHGISAFGDLKYPAGFQHFDYVDPTAPKGGRLALVGGALTFDNFNPFILKGDAAQGVADLVFESLMVRATDEPDAMYGAIAHSAHIAPDRLSVTFDLRPEARFSDKSPLTADDVVFSFVTLKEKGHPNFRARLRDVTKVTALGLHRVTYEFQGTQVRDLPLVVASLPVLSKAYYARVNFEETSLQPPVGSGPYALTDFRHGASVTYTRRPDWWGRNLPVNNGRFNFDAIRFEYYRDRTAQLEGLKAGEYDFREEFTARDWATAYDVPQVRDGRIRRLTLPDDNPSGAQGFFVNTRRPKFADPRVRRALDLAFDYQWMNANLFYGLYQRTASYFENSPMKASGPPTPAELALLEPFRDKLAPEVLPEVLNGVPYSPPISNGSGADRKNLREAVKVLASAGWTIRTETVDESACGTLCSIGRSVGLGRRRTEQIMRNARGEPLEIEFLTVEATSERIVNPYVQTLRLLGIRASVRRVDPAQYQRRMKTFDFDIVTQRYVMRLTPGSELLNYFSSRAAETEGSFNLSGIASPVVDGLIGKIQEARTRDELTTAARALDRVLRAGHYWVPQWFKASHNIAAWDRFGRPAVKPRYDRGVLDTWWYDSNKAAKLSGGAINAPAVPTSVTGR
jgi:microcin C transport system substrate-binding protein